MCVCVGGGGALGWLYLAIDICQARADPVVRMKVDSCLHIHTSVSKSCLQIYTTVSKNSMRPLNDLTNLIDSPVTSQHKFAHALTWLERSVSKCSCWGTWSVLTLPLINDASQIPWSGLIP